MAIGFASSWELILVISFAFPLTAVGNVAHLKATLGSQQREKKRMEESGRTFFESVDNIRTVVSLGVEKRFREKYSSQLQEPFRL